MRLRTGIRRGEFVDWCVKKYAPEATFRPSEAPCSGPLGWGACLVEAFFRPPIPPPLPRATNGRFALLATHCANCADVCRSWRSEATNIGVTGGRDGKPDHRLACCGAVRSALAGGAALVLGLVPRLPAPWDLRVQRREGRRPAGAAPTGSHSCRRSGKWLRFRRPEQALPMMAAADYAADPGPFLEGLERFHCWWTSPSDGLWEQ